MKNRYNVLYRVNKQGSPVEWREQIIEATCLYEASDIFWDMIIAQNLNDCVDHIWFRKEK